MEIERVINGISKYMDREIFARMNDWQEMLARIAMSRVVKDPTTIKETILGNPFLRTFAIIDDSGNVDIEHLLNDIREQIERKQKLEISIPMFGKFNFVPEDVDHLRRYILEG